MKEKSYPIIRLRSNYSDLKYSVIAYIEADLIDASIKVLSIDEKNRGIRDIFYLIAKSPQAHSLP